MKTLPLTALPICLVSFLLSLAPTQGQGQETVEFDVVHLSDHAVIVRQAGPQPTNLIALNAGVGIVVIDTGVSTAVAEAARRRIEEIFGRADFAYLINTHEHGDHTYGNQAFADVTIVGHREVPARMEANETQRHRTHQQVMAGLAALGERMAGMDPASEEAARLQGTVAYYQLLATGLGEAFRLTPPTVTFSQDTTLDLGDSALELVWFGKAHSDSDILIFWPEEGLLATGDLFAPGYDPYLDSERVSFLPRWTEMLNWALDQERGVKTVVPAHGDTLSISELVRVRDYVKTQQDLLEGKSSAFLDFRETFEGEGLEAALRRMDELRAQPDAFFFFHAEFDSFVYGLMLEEALDQAIPLFEKLAVLFPEVPNAFDSLGEAYLRAEREEEASTAFDTCLQLDPEHQNAQRRLAQIKG